MFKSEQIIVLQNYQISYSENALFSQLSFAHQRASAEAPTSTESQVPHFINIARVILEFAAPGASNNTIF